MGILERFLVLAAFWIPEWAIIGGWLAFKLASGWQTWANIIKVPSEFPGVPPLQYFLWRKQLGAYVYSRFIIGTLLNILVGLLAWYIGRSGV
jgi:hypothetical protein